MKNKLSNDEIKSLKEKIQNRLNSKKNNQLYDEDEIDFDEIANEITKVKTEEEANELLEDYHVVDLIEVVDEIDNDADLLRFFRLLDDENKAYLLEESDEDLQIRLIDMLNYDEIIAIFEYMSPDDVADILGEIEFNKSKNILDRMKRSEANKLRELLGYGEDTAGGIMTTRFIAFKSNLCVSEVMEKIRVIAPRTEYIETVFVLDQKKELLGEVDLRDILISDPNTMLNDIMNDNIISVHASDDQEKVAQVASKYGLKVIPVVNNKDNLLGIITIDDIIDVIQEENTEDILKLAGAADDEELSTPLYSGIIKRLPWLIINLGTAFLASFTVGLFENTLSKVVALAVAMPIVSGMGGNAGTQGLAVTIRAIALGEYEEKEKYRLIIKYMINGIFSGTILGVLGGIIVYIMLGNIYISLVLFLAMIGDLVVGCVMGFVIPIILNALKIDPAVSSAVILTTFTDCCGFIFFLGIATLFINKLV